MSGTRFLPLVIVLGAACAGDVPIAARSPTPVHQAIVDVHKSEPHVPSMHCRPASCPWKVQSSSRTQW